MHRRDLLSLHTWEPDGPGSGSQQLWEERQARVMETMGRGLPRVHRDTDRLKRLLEERHAMLDSDVMMARPQLGADAFWVWRGHSIQFWAASVGFDQMAQTFMLMTDPCKSNALDQGLESLRADIARRVPALFLNTLGVSLETVAVVHAAAPHWVGWREVLDYYDSQGLTGDELASVRLGVAQQEADRLNVFFPDVPCAKPNRLRM